MPNTPALVGEAASAIVFDKNIIDVTEQKFIIEAP